MLDVSPKTSRLSMTTTLIALSLGSRAWSPSRIGSSRRSETVCTPFRKSPRVCRRVVFPDPVSPLRIRNAPQREEAISSWRWSNFRNPSSTGTIKDLRSWPFSIFSTLSNRIGTLGLGMVMVLLLSNRA